MKNHPSISRLQRPCLLVKGTLWSFVVLAFASQEIFGLMPNSVTNVFDLRSLSGLTIATILAASALTLAFILAIARRRQKPTALTVTNKNRVYPISNTYYDARAGAKKQTRQ
jgi:hypothetical protein